MRTRWVVMLVLGLAVVAGCKRKPATTEPAPGGDRPPELRVRGTFTISKATTYIEGPLDDNKHIDYAGALNARLSKGVTPENNSFALIWKAIGPKTPDGERPSDDYFKRLGIPTPPQGGDYFVSLDRHATDQLKLDDDNRKAMSELVAALQTQPQPWTAKDRPEIDSWLKANEKPLVVVIEATKRTHFYSPIIPNRTGKGQMGILGAPLPGAQTCRSFAAALLARAMLHTGQGDVGAAWQDLLACHRLGRLVGRGGTLVEGLVGCAIEELACKAEIAFLAHTQSDAKQLDRYLRDLRALPEASSVAEKVDLGERFMLLDVFMMLNQYGMRAVSEGRDADVDLFNEELLDGIDWDPVLRLTNGWVDRFAMNMRVKNRADREREYRKLEAELLAMKNEGGANRAKLLAAETENGTPLPMAKGKVTARMMVPLLMPAVHKMAHAADRAAQSHANVLTAFALAQYHRENGKYPDKLDALAPKYLPKVPSDLFTEGGLVYKPTADGYLLYSVGPNGRDDGGQGYDSQPPGDDIAVRMPPR